MTPLMPDDERLQREVWLAEWHQRDEQGRQRDEQQRLEYRAAQAEAARHRAAVAAEQQQRALRLERQERINREVREREVRDLQLKVTRQSRWQQEVDRAARNAVVQR